MGRTVPGSFAISKTMQCIKECSGDRIALFHDDGMNWKVHCVTEVQDFENDYPQLPVKNEGSL